MQKNNWFEVDKKGLQQVQSEKDKFFIIKELVSNSFDEDISICDLNIKRNHRLLILMFTIIAKMVSEI